MVQTLTQPVTFDEFIAWYPDTGGRYELHDGVVVEMPKPTGKHSEITGFLIEELVLAIVQMEKRGLWTIPREAIVHPGTGKSGYEPDLIVLDRECLETERRWANESVVENPRSIRLVVEVVSSNWRDDYFKKRADYEEMGIAEYWIVDYAALGGRVFIGDPKVPTLSIYQLVEGEYQVRRFQNGDRVESSTFPELELTAERIFEAGT